ncbi:MAG: GGDEF domain-containing protein [Gammaproteobacteria bacterium]|nr:GGDEF domain-containing protein [Gammaproteobacteria bacterium]MBU1625684.1 GGDEF domain-containing protein [Gammaproteobacteria bacterium]MBU1980944.1 GGDEF domain-containing protein [Gammaproteobacteria bacterium]
MNQHIPMRHFFILLGLVALAEMLLMMTVDPMMEASGYPVWIRAMADAGLLAIICVPFMLNFQLRPMQMAYHDPLTGLPNRQLFNDRLAHVLVMAKREQCSFAVIFLDLDNFKPINDRFGHRVGDVVLKLAAVRIESGVRESDTVARLGGDEFAILLADAESTADAERVIRKISEALSRPFEVRGHILELGISAGVAFYPADGVSGMELIDAADDAMYRNKALRKTLEAMPEIALRAR